MLLDGADVASTTLVQFGFAQADPKERAIANAMSFMDMYAPIKRLN
jgi:hypothetical protein